MKLSDLDAALSESVPEAGPSTREFEVDGEGPRSLENGNGNGHLVTNGNTNGLTTLTNGNGVASSSYIQNLKQSQNGVLKSAPRDRSSVVRVTLPGTKLYESVPIDREEYVRLVIQSLRDVGYMESASTLEAESGYVMESREVTEFRRCILEAKWDTAIAMLSHFSKVDEENLRIASFLIHQQKYLELLEIQDLNAALHALRHELAPMTLNPDTLHTLSSLMMCSTAEDLKARAQWDGAGGTSRKELLDDLQSLIPSSIMIPQRRMSSLIEQAFAHQWTNCLYHNSPYEPSSFSLYADHTCPRDSFPRVTTQELLEHKDEVWNIQWSHDGQYLASAGKDKLAIIWRYGMGAEEGGSGTPKWYAYRMLRDHEDSVGCLAWSLDDSILLTSAENVIKMWNSKTGLCVRDMDAHTDMVTSVEWLPDGSGIVTGGMDKRIIRWEADGKQQETWATTSVRITDLAIAPDLSQLVVVGMVPLYLPPASGSGNGQENGSSPSPSPSTSTRNVEHRMIIYDWATKRELESIRLDGELTSVKISQDSRYALVNHAPDEVQLWDLASRRMARKFTGQRQGRHVIRSCYGGVDGNFVVSGSEDARVHIWHRDTGALLEQLAGHGSGSVNAVAWNPTRERILASCSDDCTIRIWEPSKSDATYGLDSNSRVDEEGKGKGKSKDQ